MLALQSVTAVSPLSLGHLQYLHTARCGVARLCSTPTFSAPPTPVSAAPSALRSTCSHGPAARAAWTSLQLLTRSVPRVPSPREFQGPRGTERPQRQGRPWTPGRPETGEDTDTRKTTETGEATEVGETRDQRGRGVRGDQGDHGHCPLVPTARALLTSPKVENKPDGGGSGLRWEEHDPDAAPDRPTAGSREGPRAGSDSSHRRPDLPCTLRHGWIQPSSDGIRTSLSNLGLRRVWVLEPRGPGGLSPHTSRPCTVTRQRRAA